MNLSALATAISICFAFVWANYEVAQYSSNALMSRTAYSTETVARDVLFQEISNYHLRRFYYVALGIVGMVIASISMLLRRRVSGV
jgi:hypothetical protein